MDDFRDFFPVFHRRNDDKRVNTKQNNRKIRKCITKTLVFNCIVIRNEFITRLSAYLGHVNTDLFGARGLNIIAENCIILSRFNYYV